MFSLIFICLLFFNKKEEHRIFMSYLIFVRHGESIWNLDNKFTGWVDVSLSKNGIKESIKCAKYIKNIDLDIAFTSKLIRATQCLSTILSEFEDNYVGIFEHTNKKRKEWSKHVSDKIKKEVPIYSTDALNERYYGKLQGLNKEETAKKYGEKQVFLWRRSYDVRPPGGECLKDVYKRAVPYFEKVIYPYVKQEKNILVCSHGNTIRTIIKYIDNISDKDIPFLELATGMPIVYEYSKSENKLFKLNEKYLYTRPYVLGTH